MIFVKNKKADISIGMLIGIVLAIAVLGILLYIAYIYFGKAATVGKYSCGNELIGDIQGNCLCLYRTTNNDKNAFCSGTAMSADESCPKDTEVCTFNDIQQKAEQAKTLFKQAKSDPKNRGKTISKSEYFGTCCRESSYS